MDVIGKNVSANIGRRRKVVAAVEARIRIQIEPLEVPIQIDLDVPHLVLGQPIAFRKALSTSRRRCFVKVLLYENMLLQFGHRCRIPKFTALM
jgi:hypothetical protein